MTFIRTTEGWLYLAVVLDLYSRKIVGWSMGDARLAAAMQIHQLTHILTLNGKDFERFAEIKAVHPRDL